MKQTRWVAMSLAVLGLGGLWAGRVHAAEETDPPAAPTMQETLSNLAARVATLETAAITNAELRKRVRVHREIDFLTEQITGLPLNTFKVDFFTSDFPWLVDVHAENRNGKTDLETLTDLEAGLQLAPKTNLTTVGRIDRMHKELGNPDWLTDSYRFGALLTYLPDAEAIAGSLALRIYPSYHRHLDAQWTSWRNWLRRFSLVVGVGTVVDRDESKLDGTGLVWTIGGGLDLTYGCSLFAGYSAYQATPDGEEAQERRDEAVIGLSLNSELFSRLMSR